MKKIIFTISVLVLFVLLLSLSMTTSKQSFNQRREILLNELSLAIEDAKDQGRYGCCIEPPCTMCYLGNWIWDDGTCNCDEMIKINGWDNVCPQCIKGIEEGKCKSERLNKTCSVI